MGKYEKGHKEEGLICANSMKYKNAKICYKPKKAKVNLWAVVDKTNANELPCKPDGIFFIFKDTNKMSDVFNMIHNIGMNEASPLLPTVFFCFEDISSYNSWSLEEGHLSPEKDNDIKKMKQSFIEKFKSQYENNREKLIFHTCTGFFIITGIKDQMNNLLERIMETNEHSNNDNQENEIFE